MKEKAKELRKTYDELHEEAKHSLKGLEKLIEEARKRSVFRICLRASEMGKSVYKQFGFDEPDKWMELDL